MQRDQMKIGGRYNWRNQPERLIYLGCNWSSNGYWHQFALVNEPDVVWSEILDSDLQSIEETAQSINISSVLTEIADARIKKPGRKPADAKISARQWRKQRKADKRAQQPKEPA